MSQNWSRYWRPQEQCPRQGSYSLIRKLDDSYAKMDLEQEKDGFEWPNRGFGNQDTFEGPLTGGMGHWGAEDPSDKGQSLLPGEGRDTRDRERRECPAELWAPRDGIEMKVNSMGWEVSTPFFPPTLGPLQ